MRRNKSFDSNFIKKSNVVMRLIKTTKIINEG